MGFPVRCIRCETLLNIEIWSPQCICPNCNTVINVAVPHGHHHEHHHGGHHGYQVPIAQYAVAQPIMPPAYVVRQSSGEYGGLRRSNSGRILNGSPRREHSPGRREEHHHGHHEGHHHEKHHEHEHHHEHEKHKHHKFF